MINHIALCPHFLKDFLIMLTRFRLLATIFSALFVSMVVSADPPPAPTSISLSELNFMTGVWEGYLEYLDYGDNKTRVRLPTTIRYETTKDAVSYTMAFIEPDGSKVADKGGIRPVRDGSKILFDGRTHQVLAKEIDPKTETFRIVLTNTGKDDNKSATFTTTILRQKATLTITKQVKYDDQETSFVRNEFSLQRVE